MGLDVGGANIKAAVLEVSRKGVRLLATVREYFPIWLRGRSSLAPKLSELAEKVAGGGRYYLVATMTAELSDVFRNKSEGVRFVVDSILEAFRGADDVRIVATSGELITPEEAKMRPLVAAAANWAASGWLLARVLGGNLVFIDVGSTTTTVIPIVNGEVRAGGRTDPDKLVVGELVYVGVLRTNVATLVSRVPYKGYYAGVCRERFALMGDVMVVLGKLGADSYTTETADGRGVSPQECVERLSRVLCSDAEMMNYYEVREVARYVYEHAVFKLFEALVQVRSRIASAGLDPDGFEAVVAGVGEFLAEEAARRAGFRTVRRLSEMLGREVSEVFPAYAAALMYIGEEADLRSYVGIGPHGRS